MTNSLLINRALSFATEKHQGQVRKDKNKSPYINHPIRVFNLIATVANVTDDLVLASALLHDTLEDTSTTPRELETEFGLSICRIVQEVTDDKSLPKEKRKELQIASAASLSPSAVFIRIADKIANVQDVIHNPPETWSVQRRYEYILWAEKVVNNCPEPNKALYNLFENSLREGSDLLM